MVCYRGPVSGPASTSATSSLLEVRDLRVDVEGVPVCDGLTFTTRGPRALILGAPRALYEAAVGQRAVARGALQVRGTSAAGAAGRRLLAGAPLDPPLPPTWDAREYVRWSARLAGHPAAEAERRAFVALEAIQLGDLARTPLASLVLPARRAVVVAAALAVDPEVVVLDDPLADLPDEIARTWAEILVGGLGERAWVVFASRVPLTSALALAADDAVIASASEVLAQGAPSALASTPHRYVARIHAADPRSLEGLGPRLAERGASLEVQGAQVLLDLGETMTTADLLGMCVEADLTLVEMHPLTRALT